MDLDGFQEFFQLPDLNVAIPVQRIFASDGSFKVEVFDQNYDSAEYGGKHEDCEY